MSHGPQPPSFEESLKRMFAAIERADRTLADALRGHGRMRPPDPKALARAAREERRRLREEIRLERERRRAARARAKHDPNPIGGAVMIVIAAILAFLAATGQGPNWFLWVALGLGLGGAAQFRGRELPVRREQVLEAAQEAAPEAKAPTVQQDRRVDEIARQILEEIRSGPAVLREVVRKPEETVEGLRRGYHALAEREAKLRSLVTAESEARLEAERSDLVARRDRATDAVVRARYDEALEALDQQRAERAAVLTAADRMEAERTRLRYTLEGLHAQVLRAKTAHGTGPETEAALRTSLERLRDEVGAVTDALEEVEHVPLRAAQRVR